jgi:hypothetical protein
VARSIVRKTEARGPSKENTILEGGIETPVEGFFNGAFGPPPFRAEYGEHKVMGSEGAPIVKGGRGAKASFRSKLMHGSD